MRYILLVLLLISCKGNSPRADLTGSEMSILDSLQFEKSIVAEVKAITGQTFKKMQVSNVSGKEIPADFMPKMIFFKVNKTFDLKLLDDVRESGRQLGYNIYDVSQQEEYITIIISKVN